MVKTVVSLALALLMTVLLSLYLIRSRRFVVVIKPELYDVQKEKSGTPSTGGIAFYIPFILVLLFFSDIRDPYVYLPLISFVLFGIIGFVDDVMKLQDDEGDGMKNVFKLGFQIICSILIVTVKYQFVSGKSIVPGFAGFLFWVFYLTFFVNAVNIADGLDGLCGNMMLPIMLLAALVMHSSGVNFTVPMVAIAVLIGFLSFNRKPAKYFMGDLGSHALGSLIGSLALVMDMPVIMLVASLVYAVELASSFIQIFSIRVFARKVFLIAPLHHDFEKRGMGENRIVIMFSLFCWVLCIISYFIARYGGLF